MNHDPTDVSLSHNTDAIAQRGKLLIERVALSLILSSVGAILIYIMSAGFDRIAVQIVRLALTVALAQQLLKGRSWARWFTVVTSALAVALFLRAFIAFGSLTLTSLPLLIFAIVFTWIAFTLMANDTVAVFFGARKSR